MVSSGSVSAVSQGLSSNLSSFQSIVSGLSGSWEGSSYDSFVSSVDSFVSEFSAIEGQLNSFASAVASYAEYSSKKQSLKQAEGQLASAQQNDDDVLLASLNQEIAKLKQEMESLKASINGDLSAASSPVLEASSSVGDVSFSISASNVSYSSGPSAGIGGFSSPLDSYRVTSGFGYRGDIGVAGATADHKGIDLGGNPSGTPIHAAKGGTVKASQWMDGYGNVVFIDHGDGVETRYAHCSSLDVAVGQTVESGDTIAKIGSTGNSSGPHLHFEVRIDGTPVDPKDYLV